MSPMSVSTTTNKSENQSINQSIRRGLMDIKCFYCAVLSTLNSYCQAQVLFPD
jgi:hypothetical protein